MNFVVFLLILVYTAKNGCCRDCSVNNGNCEFECVIEDPARCSCGLLGTLATDGESCQHDEKIFVGNNDKLVFLYNKTYNIIIRDLHQSFVITALSNNYANKKIFYASTVLVTASLIGVVDLAHQTQKKLKDVHGTVSDIAYDNVKEWIYFTLDDGNVGVLKDIEHENISSESVAKLLGPRGIAVDSCLGYVFVTDVKAGKIVRIKSNNDETTFTETIIEDLHYPLAITVDQLSEKLFWTDADEYNYGRIDMSNYDGSCKRSVMESRMSTQPFSMLFIKGDLFWTDVTNNMILKTKIATGFTDIYQYLPQTSMKMDYYGIVDDNSAGKWSDWSSIPSCDEDCYNTTIEMRRCQKYSESFTCTKIQCDRRKIKCTNTDGALTSEFDTVIKNCNPIRPCKVSGGKWTTSFLTMVIGSILGGLVILILLVLLIRATCQKKPSKQPELQEDNNGRHTFVGHSPLTNTVSKPAIRAQISVSPLLNNSNVPSIRTLKAASSNASQACNVPANSQQGNMDLEDAQQEPVYEPICDSMYIQPIDSLGKSLSQRPAVTKNNRQGKTNISFNDPTPKRLSNDKTRPIPIPRSHTMPNNNAKGIPELPPPRRTTINNGNLKRTTEVHPSQTKRINNSIVSEQPDDQTYVTIKM